jgi:prepilin-type processing-associated H-X9-DG protein/prepilin-type N-terminal cleavage/methylation domain-containing protein
MENFFPRRGKKRPDFPRHGKLFSGFSTLWKTFFHAVENPRAASPLAGGAGLIRDSVHAVQKDLVVLYGCHPEPVEGSQPGPAGWPSGLCPDPAVAGFSMIELLAAVAAASLLAALAAGGWSAAQAAAQSAACRSNLRAMATANLAYAADHGRFVAAASDIEGANSVRWHGARSGGQAFDASRGPLAPYLGGTGASVWVRRCPAFAPDVEGFEASCGGYGYNAHGVGSELCLPGGEGTAVGMRPAALSHPSETVMFADAAFLQGSGPNARLIEYSFAEPPRFAGGGTPWPSIHFRHRGMANVAWCDGHVSSEPLARSGGPASPHPLGWFGPDDNRLFDPF